MKRAAQRPRKRRVASGAVKRPAPKRRVARAKSRARSPAKAFVLVHGAWHGGWCWRRVAALLRSRGHEVYTPTLTGLGERSHLMRAGIDLDTHIADIVNVIKWEDLANVVLVGHSYGGWVISGVVEQVLPRISSIVYLDAFLPADGQRGVDLQSEQSRAEVLAAAQDGAVSRTGPDAKWFGVAKIEDQAWVNAKLTPQPIGVSLQPLRLTGAREKVVKKTYIRAQSYAQPAFEAAYAQTKADPSWRVYDVPCGHDVMVDMPERLVAMLLDAA